VYSPAEYRRIENLASLQAVLFARRGEDILAFVKVVLKRNNLDRTGPGQDGGLVYSCQFFKGH